MGKGLSFHFKSEAGVSPRLPARGLLQCMRSACLQYREER